MDDGCHGSIAFWLELIYVSACVWVWEFICTFDCNSYARHLAIVSNETKIKVKLNCMQFVYTAHIQQYCGIFLLVCVCMFFFYYCRGVKQINDLVWAIQIKLQQLGCSEEWKRDIWCIEQLKILTHSMPFRISIQFIYLFSKWNAIFDISVSR